MKLKTITVFWFRRDLRLSDNTALNKAIRHSKETNSSLMPLFVFDTEILSELDAEDHRLSFIHSALEGINKKLQDSGTNIYTFLGSPKTVFKELFKTYSIDAVFCNEDYEPYARDRDQSIKELCESNNASLFSFKDQLIFHKDEIVKSDGTPYVVYTPYKNQWLSAFEQLDLKIKSSVDYSVFVKESPKAILSLKELGFIKSPLNFPSFEVELSVIDNYQHTRDIPSNERGTSHLGVHLRFGTISIRELILHIQKTKNHQTYLSELIWREFFMQILWHYPHTVHQSFKPQYDRIEWRNNTEEFEHWKNGTTGYPMVDAGMRELNQTGYMHNRVRMICASFLCKHLLIDWRWGEAYFAEKLIDYELSSNIGNWQWASGSGVDAAPYFRIFNPHTQLKKFDPELKYVQKWVPEYQSMVYPNEIVNHKMARERCLETYKKALNQ